MKAFVENLFPQYQYVSSLGEGKISGSCQVVERRPQEGEQPLHYCVKLIYIEGISDTNLKIMMNTLQRIQEIQSPLLINVVNWAYNPSKTHFAIVSEFAYGGSLAAEITRVSHEKNSISEDDIWDYIFQLCNALLVLHKAGIIHKQIKSSNIFLSKDKKSLMIGDIGVKHLLESMKTSYESIPYSQSPEGFGGKFCFESDIWSLGCVIFEMFAQRLPFWTRDIDDLQRKIEAAKIPKVETMPRNLQLLIDKMVVVNPKNRPDLKSLMQFVTAAQHKGKSALEKMLSPKPNRILSSSISSTLPTSPSFILKDSLILPKIDQNSTHQSQSFVNNDNSFNLELPNSTRKPPLLKTKKPKIPLLVLPNSPKLINQEQNNSLETKSIKGNTQSGQTGIFQQKVLSPPPTEPNRATQTHTPKPSMSKNSYESSKLGYLDIFQEASQALDKAMEIQQQSKKKSITSHLGILPPISNEYDRQKQEQRHIVFMTDVARVVKMKQSSPKTHK